MEMAWKIWKMNLKELLESLVFILGGTVFGMVIVAVMVAIEGGSYAVLGSFLAFLIWLMVFIIAGAVSFERQFSMAVAMGRTRTEFLVCRYLTLLVNTLTGLFVIMGIHIFETELDKVLYRGIPCEFSVMDVFMNVYIMAFVIILLPVLCIFLGMLLAKFQRKALWALWVVWMLGSIILPQITAALSNEPHGIFARFSGILRWIVGSVINLGAAGQLGMVLFAAALLLAVSGAVLKRHTVTQI